MESGDLVLKTILCESQSLLQPVAATILKLNLKSSTART